MATALKKLDDWNIAIVRHKVGAIALSHEIQRLNGDVVLTPTTVGFTTINK